MSLLCKIWDLLTLGLFHHSGYIGALIVFAGLIWFYQSVFKTLRFVYRLKLAQKIDILERYGKGSYVLITGSTDGIGKKLMFKYAALGFNLVSISRNQLRLNKTAEEVKKESPKCHIISIQADLAKTTPEFYKELDKKLENIDISVLVNNVGLDSIELFHEQSFEFMHNLMAINMYTLTFMSKILFDRLKKRRHASIVNIASVAADHDMAYFAVYNGTKAYVARYTQSLMNEYPKLDITLLKPAEVSTGMNNNRSLDIFTISSEDSTSGMMHDIERGIRISNGSWNHTIQAWLYLTVPSWLYMTIWEKFVVADFCKERKITPPTPIERY